MPLGVEVHYLTRQLILCLTAVIFKFLSDFEIKSISFNFHKEPKWCYLEHFLCTTAVPRNFTGADSSAPNNVARKGSSHTFYKWGNWCEITQLSGGTLSGPLLNTVCNARFKSVYLKVLLNSSQVPHSYLMHALQCSQGKLWSNST